MLRFLSPIHKAGRQVSVYFEEQTRDLDVSPQEGHLLGYLRAYAPCPISELARVFGLKLSTLTSMLDRLEGRDLLERSLNPDDRRSFVIRLTRSGRRLADRLQTIVEDLERMLEREVSVRDVKGFESVMRAVGAVTQVRLRDER